MLTTPSVVAPIAAPSRQPTTKTSDSSNPTAASANGDGEALYSDSFALPRVSVWRVVLAIVGYLLLVTDVARSGANLTDLGFPTIEPNVFASEPPRVLPSRVFKRTTGSNSAATYSVTTSVVGSSSAETSEAVDARWYKFSPTSHGMRTLYTQRPAELSSWPSCLQHDYDAECGATLPAKTVFTMLDHTINTVRDNANQTTCYKTMVTHIIDSSQQIVTVPDAEVTRNYLGRLPQRVRFAVRAKARWLDGASNFLSHYVLDHKYWMSVWATYFDDFNATEPGMAICADELDRPLLCEKTWADFNRLAPNQGVDKIWDDISDRAAALQTAHPGKTLEMSIIETETDPLMLFGGAILVAHKLYDVVVLYRLMDCASSCTTDEVHEVRYGGRVLYSDVVEWQYVTLVMRWTAQVYMIVRLIFLMIGCYQAAPFVQRPRQDSSADAFPSPPPRWRTTLNLFFAIPPQVVVYGSFIPVLLYSSAHVIDGVAYYQILADKMASFSTFFSFSFNEVIRMTSIYTRNLWVAAFAVRVLVFIDTSGGWTPLSGVSGVKGYLLPFLSATAVLFVLRDTSFEDARVLESNEVEPSATFMVIRAETLDSWKMNAGGVYKDILTVGMTTIIYIILAILARVGTKLVSKRSDLSWWPEAICWTRYDVPYAAGYLWDPSCLMVAWENDVIASVLGNELKRIPLQVPSQLTVREETNVDPALPTTNVAYVLGDVQTRAVLMNITFLSDPWNYMTIKLGHTRVNLYQLRIPGKPNRKILHPFSKARFQREFEMKHEEVLQVATFNTSNMAWGQMIMCR